MSTFNPDAFMSTSVKEANDTKFTPIPDHPEGEGWESQVDDVKARQVKGKDGTPSFVIDLTWAILAEPVKKETGLDKPTVRQTVWLDLTKEGNLDFGKGKNVQLGRVREALGQNKPGKAWKPQDLMGQMAKVVTKQRPDPENPENIYNDVKKVLPL